MNVVDVISRGGVRRCTLCVTRGNDGSILPRVFHFLE